MKLLRSLTKALLLAMFLVFALFPLFWILITSLKGGQEIYAFPVRYWPQTPTFDNYRYLFRISDFSIYFRNSLVVSLVASVGAMIISVFSGYALSRMRSRRPKFVLLLAMYFTQIIPTYMLMSPLFISLAKIGMTDSLIGITFAYVSMMIAFSTIMAKSFFDRIPVALEEAAMTEGCTRTQTIFKIILPLTLPGLAAIFSFAFVNIWNELFLAVMLLSSNHKMTVPVALNSFISKAGVNWGVLSAGIVVALLPTMIVFAFAQKFIIMGLTEGAVKG
ncbi:MAG TPA: carbohydrate ABC transporter permease [Limnochordia bacterium]|nr:carbohydrate ABC transporter permease [Bacillota bacterium]HOK32195.1 carbohydrate ABC transporter permease [Limnochordia bacterium]HPP73009.1 carbohydrate ABC transporter permease [Limnochordia bacterium]HPT83474.1 carbohydrate ABC transporter permease [Limnochordia bacterium]